MCVECVYVWELYVCGVGTCVYVWGVCVECVYMVGGVYIDCVCVWDVCGVCVHVCVCLGVCV